jgi:hypothetical protein
MIEHIRAVFREGAFYPVTPCPVPENLEVTLIVQPANLQPPTVTDPEERRAILKRLTERMMQRTLPPDAPRFTRDQLHERR